MFFVMFGMRRLAVLRAFFVGERRNIAQRQSDLSLARIDLDDSRAQCVARLIHSIEFRLPFARDLGDVRERLHSVGQANEETEVGDLGDDADDVVVDVMRLREFIPIVRQKFAHGEGEALIVGVDVDDARLHAVAFLQHFGRMFDAAVP